MMWLPETLAKDRRNRMALGDVLRGYFGIAQNRIAMMYLFSLSCMSGVFFVYVAATPFLYIETYGLWCGSVLRRVWVVWALGHFGAGFADDAVVARGRE